jgi:hypothetical protein
MEPWCERSVADKGQQYNPNESIGVVDLHFKRFPRRNPSSTSNRFRAICSIHRPAGSRPIPTISTARHPMSIAKSTWYRTSPNSVITSTVKKSIPTMAPR